MKTIKIIDLLIMRANGEDTPKFWWNGCVHELEDDWEGGVHKIWDTYCKVYKEITLDILNDEIKIIEEEKEIETIDMSSPISVVHCAMKINELIDAVNELKKDKQSCHAK